MKSIYSLREARVKVVDGKVSILEKRGDTSVIIDRVGACELRGYTRS